jgi:hypothetical protein
MVCCACDALTLAKTAAIAPAARIHLEDFRIMPAPLFRCPKGAIAKNMR